MSTTEGDRLQGIVFHRGSVCNRRGQTTSYWFLQRECLRQKGTDYKVLVFIEGVSTTEGDRLQGIVFHRGSVYNRRGHRVFITLKYVHWCFYTMSILTYGTEFKRIYNCCNSSITTIICINVMNHHSRLDFLRIFETSAAIWWITPHNYKSANNYSRGRLWQL